MKQKINLGTTGADSRRVLEALTPLTEVPAGAPDVNADYIGQIFVDQTTPAVYISVAVDSVDPADDWKEVTLVAGE